MLKSIPDAQPDLTTDLANSANALGFEIVDIAGFFERLEQLCVVQKQSAGALNSASRTLTGATDTIVSGCRTMSASTDAANDAATKTLEGVRASDASARKVATWVHDLSDRSTSIHAALEVVKSHNALIAGIARQVNMLAINAKIEAARAGELGRGFSVVANAINELSQQTGKAAVQIADGVENLAGWVEELAQDSQTIGDEAENVLSKASENQANFSQLAASLSSNLKQVTSITSDVERMRGAVEQLLPAVRSIDDSVEETSDGISGATKRTARLVDISETLVQQAAAAGGRPEEAQFVAYVQDAAARTSALFEAAIEAGDISEEALFDDTYVPIPNTNPQQVMTRFTEFTDRVLPDIQEAALKMSSNVVFCAAVDTHGYLPTHNRKFSKPQSDDPVWNTANCRNRRIFDDRVGLKAGRSTAPFLQQTYRRDMGGGDFPMMKDFSAPIFVNGRHWGGLRLAIRF